MEGALANGTNATDQTAAADANGQTMDGPSCQDGRRSKLSPDVRIDRIRERNRVAQARYRQKRKEESQQLQARIQAKQQQLSARKAHLASLQSRNVQMQATTCTTGDRGSHCSRVQRPSMPLSPGSQLQVPQSPALPQQQTAQARPHRCHQYPRSDRPQSEAVTHSRTPSRHARHDPDAPGTACSPQHAGTGSPMAGAAPPGVAPLQAPVPSAACCATTSTPARSKACLPQPESAPRSLIPHHTPGTLHHALSPLPPPISSYRVTAGISYADLLEASGSATGTPDFTEASMPALVRSVRAAKAARLGCHEGDVCFFVQLHWIARPQAAAPAVGAGDAAGEAALGDAGLPLSMSSTLSTPECVASSVLMYLVADLEILLRATRTGNVVPPAEIRGPDARQAGPDSAAACAAQHDAKRVCGGGDAETSDAQLDPIGSPVSRARISCMLASSATCSDCAGVGAARSAGQVAGGGHADTPRACGVWSGMVSCGVNQTCCARCAAHSIVWQIVREAYGSERGEELWATCRKVLQEVVAMADGIHDGGSGGSGSGGGAGPADERAALVDAINNAAAGVLLVVRDVLEELLAGQLDRVAGAADSSSAECDSAACDSAACDSAACDSAACDSAACDSAACDSVSYREHTFRATVCFGMALSQAYRDSPRTIRTMGLSAARPLMKYFEVENMHVQLYRQLGLSAADKERMADVWHAWERRRRALNKPYHAALAALRTLEGLAALPDTVVRSITACENGWAQHTCPGHAQHGARARQATRTHAWDACGGAGSTAVAGSPQHVPRAGLLGECAVATGVAVHAFRELSAVHRADAELYVEMVELQIQPEAMYSLDTMSRFFCAHLVHGVAPADFLALCQLAAAQRSRAQLFQLPFVHPMLMHGTHAHPISL